MDKEILQRYVEGNVNPEEIIAVVDWLDADENNVREFMALHKLNDISLLNQADNRADNQKKKRTVSFRKIGYELAKIAAILIIFWGGTKLFETNTTEESIITYQTLYVPAGQRAELILPDSTRVWLNAHSKLIYPVSFGKGNRQVELNGEAYFDVVHNEKQPFIVKTRQMDIQVLGTEFNVTSYSSDFEVSLLRGCIELSSPNLSSTYRMKEKEHIKLKNNKLIINNITDYDYFRWKEGLICFNNESVATIIEKLKLYYDINIETHNKKFLNSRYSGKFRTKDGIEQVLKVLQIEHKFSYTKNNDLNLITIK
ncbi:FecR family protein [Parabacteroides sp. AM58-2XD]|jgi:transmembrane sensor|uniref:FecR family protein n=1 Tax=Parabacteroides segnis TaxID=2763058 RepID=A0ABR7DWT3_9BACT|nr:MULTISPECIES: FecR family protein [Parabacteroides]MBC5641383.1 FecR family protein [Parabacteroides segnis]MCM0711131.1 FecR family protein [Parabacteroides sp. TA-V-105]MCM0721059.1 FecR family protein [Parabacteroides sp. W1-Q-101]RGZ01016.1 FecR family protein [Parabacteroides sp. AM58-2XD]GKG72317.1 anti-sigma factor [Parabacteroides goldsteinii]